MPPIQYLRGNILEFAEDYYIAHQCNCITTYAKGLAQHIFAKYPAADIYSDGTKRALGDVVIRGNVINMLAQYSPGSRRRLPMDSNDARIDSFKTCLSQIGEALQDGDTVVFPYKIGCGLAGGDWKIYEKMLADFAEEHATLQVVIVELAPE
jgi:hypothetical protein